MDERSVKGRGAERRLVLLNPNTNAATTAAMVAIAQEAAGLDATVEGVSAPFGAALITTPEELALGAEAVAAACGTLAANPPDGLIVSAFGDPGLETARQHLSIPVAGIAEAAMWAAAAHGRFGIVTTTPALVASIEGLARLYGFGEALASVRLTTGDPAATMRDPETLLAALELACHEAIEYDSVDAIVIGGGPLAAAARQLARRLPVPVIEPIPAAVASLLKASG